MKRRVVVTGLGAITPICNSVDVLELITLQDLIHLNIK